MHIILDNKERQLTEAICQFWPKFQEDIQCVDSIAEIEQASSVVLVICHADMYRPELEELTSEIHIYYKDKLDEQLKFGNVTSVIENVNTKNFQQLFLNRYKIYSARELQQNQDLDDVNDLNLKLDHVLKSFESELIRIKKIYKRLVPVRKSLHKGMRLKSKYITGESSGGEFFDVIEKNKQILLVAHSCNSYLASSCFITMFSILQSGEQIADTAIELFLESVNAEMKAIESSLSKTAQSDIFLLRLDTVSLEYKIWNFGGFEVFDGVEKFVDSNNEVASKEGMSKVVTIGRLNRDARYLIASPGLFKNWDHYQINPKFNQFLKSNIKLESEDFFDEVAINLKSKSNDDFVKHDTSMLIFEVDKNAIIKV